VIQEASVVPVFPEDFPGLLPLLRVLDPQRSADSWRPIFEYRWRRAEEPVGYGLKEGERFVGYLGMIRSEMKIDGRVERFCNISSWIVLDEAQGAGAFLAMTLRRLNDTTITSFTSNERARKILLRLGFRQLDGSRAVLKPRVRSLRKNWNRGEGVLLDPSEFEFRLEPAHRRILEDHRSYARHVFFEEEGAYCYAVFTLRRRWGFRAVRFHYISNPQRFAVRWPEIQAALLRRQGAVFGETEVRLLMGIQPPSGSRIEPGAPRLYISDRLRPDQVPELYSELILLSI
jgi:hypothetical protein